MQAMSDTDPSVETKAGGGTRVNNEHIIEIGISP